MSERAGQGISRRVAGIRGATSVDRDSPEDILSATRELLAEIVARNDLTTAEIISAIFTVTHDLTGDFPARAARELGWHDVPLLCTMEIPVTGALPRCVRVLLHVETTRSRAQLQHVYQRAARSLRPDLLRD